MKVTTKERSVVTEIASDAVVLGIHEGQELDEHAARIDAATDGALTRLLELEEISGKKGRLGALLAPHGVAAGQVVLVGLGKKDEWNVGGAFQAAAAAAKSLASRPRKQVSYFLGQDWSDAQLEAAVAGSVVGCQGQGIHQSEAKMHAPEETAWVSARAEVVQRGVVLGESVNLTRRLVNEPPNVIYPESFAARATEVAERYGMTIEVWDRERLEQERCGALLAVARGSEQPPRLVIMRYAGAGGDDTPLALVGKGVTFDSGGLSLKPSDGMKTMKCDMAGAATVVGAMQAIARLKLPLNVTGLVGLVENMPSAGAYKLGDVLTSRNGKTIEVLNTDAEGRLVLADVLAVAVERNAQRIIDLATLTGACLVALGTDVAGLMTNDEAWCAEVARAAGACGERVWQLPMFPEYGELIKSDVADIKNIGSGRWGGAITAAKFLEEFVGETKWVHVDIAGPAFLESSKPWMDGGGTGALVRTLVEVARGMSESV